MTDFVAARKALPGKWTVADAARGFVAYKAKEEREGAAPAPIKFSAAVAKFHERNERRGLSEGYKNDCRKHLKMLGKTLDDAIIQSIRQPELNECLEAATNGGARRFNNLRCTLNALFGFCQKEGLLPRDRLHEAALIEKKQQRNFEPISTYTPQEMRVILANVCDELLPWVVLGGMAGLRVSEIHRLRWENVRLDAGVITLDKAFTKTKKRRVVQDLLIGLSTIKTRNTDGRPRKCSWPKCASRGAGGCRAAPLGKWHLFSAAGFPPAPREAKACPLWLVGRRHSRQRSCGR